MNGEPDAGPPDGARTEPEVASPGPQTSRRRAALGYDARAERRTLRGAARRRKARTKLWLVAGPVIVVIAVVVTLLSLLGGPDTEAGEAPVTTTTLRPTGVVDLLVIEQEGTIPYMVLVRTAEEGGLVLALPGITLVKTAAGFLTLAEVYTTGGPESLRAALDAEVGVRTGAVASVAWPGFREAMSAAHLAVTPGATLTSTDGEAQTLAESVAALVVAAGSEAGSNAWRGLAVGGDGEQFRGDMEAAGTSFSAGRCTAAALPGRVVQGDGFIYLEPEMDRLAVLLAGDGEGDEITVEIQNGAGMVGVVELAAKELEVLGYKLESTGNSEDFPNVGITRITVSLDAVAAGERVRALLGAGAVVEDVTLESGHVVVVLGRDYAPPATTDTGPAG